MMSRDYDLSQDNNHRLVRDEAHLAINSTKDA
jgi:hypothetical protein